MKFDDRRLSQEDFVHEILQGLLKPVKSLPPKFFYDDEGSELFLRITELPEYYLTRAEKGILPQAAQELGRKIGPGIHVIEYGCGNSGKVQTLLDGLQKPASYLAIDIARSHLLEFCSGLAASRSDLMIQAICADFTRTLDLDLPQQGTKLAFFPGSSIGNFEPNEAIGFLGRIRQSLGEGANLLIGVDLKKSASVLNAAYNDGEGVTARFNLNLLKRINREAHGDFDLSAFRHIAFYNESQGRIEMHLESLKDQVVTVSGTKIHFRLGERTHTENSYKYSLAEFRTLSRKAGWETVATWVDKDQLFSLHYLSAPHSKEGRSDH